MCLRATGRRQQYGSGIADVSLPARRRARRGGDGSCIRDGVNVSFAVCAQFAISGPRHTYGPLQLWPGLLILSADGVYEARTRGKGIPRQNPSTAAEPFEQGPVVVQRPSAE